MLPLSAAARFLRPDNQVMVRRNMDISDLEETIGYKFNDNGVLYQALSHSSYTYEKKGTAIGNERLEFLGDSILGLVVGDTLFKRLPDDREGSLTKKRALVVCETSLSQVANDISLGKYLKLGKGELLSGGGKRSSNLSNAVEALIAAVYIDGGYKAAYDLTIRLFNELIEDAMQGDLVYDYKSKLIELVQSYDQPGSVDFKIISEEGPVHARIFNVTAVFEGKEIGHGSGTSKKEAEQAASKIGLQTIKRNKL